MRPSPPGTVPWRSRGGVAGTRGRWYDCSLGKDLHKKVDDKLHLALMSLLMPAADFVASRLEKAMKGWFNDNSTLICLLGGLDGIDMHAVCAAYAKKCAA